MKLTSLKLHGFSSAFPGVVDLPLREIPPGLVALVGGNGEGKTTLIETIPAAIYFKLPARRDIHPVDFAIRRDAFIDLEYAFDGVGAFRSRINLDSQTRKSDALLEQLQEDGPTLRLTDGKVSTYRAAIESRFPSFDLFLNSAFAAQGRGDEFARATPSKRKDLFVEFLALSKLLTMAAGAGEAAALCEDARLRLQVQIDGLSRETAPALFDALDRWAEELQVKGLDAETRQQVLTAQIAQLSAREQLAADSMASYAAAALRLQTINGELQARQQEHTTSVRARDAFGTEAETELAAIAVRVGVNTELKARQGEQHAAIRDRDAFDQSAESELAGIAERLTTQLADTDQRLANNELIQQQGDAIRAAVEAIRQIDEYLTSRARPEEQECQRLVDETKQALADAEGSVSRFAVPTEQLERARVDSALLTTVPCGGEGEYAACSFLSNAKQAAGRIAALEATVAGVRAAIQQRDDTAQLLEERRGRLTKARAAIHQLIADRATHLELAKHQATLTQSDERVSFLRQQRQTLEAEATSQREDAERRHALRQAELADRVAATTAAVERLTADLKADVERQRAEASARHSARRQELEARVVTAAAAVERLAGEQRTARQDLDAAASGNSQALQLQTELSAAREARDATVATIAEVTSGRTELARRRAELDAKTARVIDLRNRLTAIESELLEWRDLAKALGKGGLPDLEIDAAGPSISGLTNALLLECYGPRFSLELVTQVEKADKSGMKDEFTVRVLDNEDAGGWRDISELSGGEKVIVQEALMCAIAIYVNERAPLPIRTLFRDETGAALEPANSLRYVAMLRKVRELGGFHHVFFISHDPAAYAQADCQIRVGGGAARIVYPPFQEAA